MNPSSPSPTGVSTGTGKRQHKSAEKRPLRGSEIAYAIFTVAVAILFFATAL
ncbi:MAG TPA: hypothetical protein VGC07_07845 [Granulicella sp.]